MDTEFSQDSGGQKSKAGVWAGLVVFEAALLGLQVAVFSLCLFSSFSLCACVHTSSFLCACVVMCVPLSLVWTLQVGLGFLAASLRVHISLLQGLEVCTDTIFFTWVLGTELRQIFSCPSHLPRPMAFLLRTPVIG